MNLEITTCPVCGDRSGHTERLISEASCMNCEGMALDSQRELAKLNRPEKTAKEKRKAKEKKRNKKKGKK